MEAVLTTLYSANQLVKIHRDRKYFVLPSSPECERGCMSLIAYEPLASELFTIRNTLKSVSFVRNGLACFSLVLFLRSGDENAEVAAI
jgi:hypothetical protein